MARHDPEICPVVCGHLDGFCIRFDGLEVAIFPTLTGAARGLIAANEALDLLEATLSNTQSQEAGR
jgi:hypothetical protein